MEYFKAVATQSTEYRRLDTDTSVSYTINVYSPDFNFPYTYLTRATGYGYPADYEDCHRDGSRWEISDEAEFNQAKAMLIDL